jgi:2-alkyl-3-oxoalkanoate reductase
MTPMRVGVAGASGVLGREVVRGLLARGHGVRALARSVDEARQKLPASPRLEVVQGDILSPQSLPGFVKGCDAILHLATAIPKAGGDWSANDRIRREGTRNLLAAAAAYGSPCYVQQSVAMLQAGARDVVSDETAAPQGGGALASAIDMEEMVRASSLRWVILRGGLFYGPGTGRSAEVDLAAQSGTLRVPGDGGNYVSLVRPDDMADAVIAAAESSIEDEIIAVVDDRPVTWRGLLDYVAGLHGVPSPPPGAASPLPSFRVSNQKARRLLEWRPRHPDYTTGWIAPPGDSA